MTDQTRWGIPEVQLKNKIKKRRQDLVARAMEHVSQDGRNRDHGPYVAD